MVPDAVGLTGSAGSPRDVPGPPVAHVAQTSRVGAARPWIRAPRFLVAVLIAAALAETVRVAALDDGVTGVTRELSLFTTQSGVILAVVLAVGALLPPARLTGRWDDVRGAAVFYACMTGVIYAVFVAEPGEMARWDVAWTNLVLHRVAPAFAVLDWLVVASVRRASWRRPLAWVAFPAAFLVYTWLRGALVDWYPYAFLDPSGDGGWGGALTTMALIVLPAFFLGATVVHVVGLGRARLTLGRAAVHGGVPRSAAVTGIDPGRGTATP